MLGTQAELLIYLPCWTDYPLALKQAEALRRQHSKLSEKVNSFSLRLIVSVNSTKLLEPEISRFKKVVDELIVYPNSIGGDTNINSGFLLAQRYQPDYFWIVSANDQIADQALAEVGAQLSKKNFDLLLLTRNDIYESRLVHDVFQDGSRDYPYGLISAVIYKTKKFSNHFYMGPKFGFTGFGQLAVIHSGVKSNEGIKLQTIPILKVISQAESLEPDLSVESDRVRFNYRHSFFGMPVLIFALYADNKKMRNKFIWKWLRGNWFRVNFFTSKSSQRHFENLTIDASTLWIEEMAQSALRNSGIRTRLLYNFVKRIPWEKFKTIPIARRVRRKIRS